MVQESPGFGQSVQAKDESKGREVDTGLANLRSRQQASEKGRVTLADPRRLQ